MPLPENLGRSETVAGGTTVAEESQNTLWLGLTALVIVLGLVVFFATGNDDDKATIPQANEAASTDETDVDTVVQVPVTADNADEIGISVDEAPPTKTELRAEALAAFKKSLTDRRLWSTVTVEGATTLKLVSGACADADMQPAISSSSAALVAVGFTAILCHEKHGAQVFEQSL